MNELKTQKKPLRILHVVLSMVVGGAEKLVYDMVRHPAFAEHRPVIACLDNLGELGEKLREEGYSVYVKGRKPGLDWSVVSWLRGIIRKERITVVHAHQYTPLFYTVPAAKLLGKRVKVVYTEHGRFYPDRKRWKRSLVNPILAKGVDHLVSISHATADAMADYDNFPRKRIKVIHNGIDVSRMNPPIDLAVKRKELGLRENCRVVGTAARLNQIKNIPMMLRSIKLILEQVPDCYLVIAGQGEDEANLRSMAKKLGISDQVKFIGLRFDLAEIYQLFDVFLLTSFSEGISVTLLEAMASGVPSVVTDVGGNVEVVVPGKTGFLVPVDGDMELSQKVVFFLKQSEQARKFGMNAKRRVDVKFEFNELIRSYLSCCY